MELNQIMKFFISHGYAMPIWYELCNRRNLR